MHPGPKALDRATGDGDHAHMAEGRVDRATALLLAAGAIAAAGVLVDWFVLPAPRSQLSGYTEFRDARYGAFAVLAAALGLWIRTVLHRDRGEPVPSVRLTGIALLLGALVLLVSPFVAYREDGHHAGHSATETVVCPGVVRLSPTPVAGTGSFSCDARRPPRIIAAVLGAVVGLVLVSSARQRGAVTGALTARTGWTRSRAQLGVLPMFGALVRMLTLDAGRFFLFGKLLSIGALVAAAAGWLVVVDRSARRVDPRRRPWLAGVLLLELAAVLLLTPYDIGGEACASPLVGGASLSALVEPTGCLLAGLLVVVVASVILAVGSVLVLLGPPRPEPTDPVEGYWAAAP